MYAGFMTPAAPHHEPPLGGRSSPAHARARQAPIINPISTDAMHLNLFTEKSVKFFEEPVPGRREFCLVAGWHIASARVASLTANSGVARHPAGSHTATGLALRQPASGLARSEE